MNAVQAVPIAWPLTLAAALFCLGIFATLTRKTAIGFFIGVELMLNAAAINLVTFWRYLQPGAATAQVFVSMIVAVAAAEAAVGLAMIIAVYRTWKTAQPNQVNSMKG